MALEQINNNSSADFNIIGAIVAASGHLDIVVEFAEKVVGLFKKVKKREAVTIPIKRIYTDGQGEKYGYCEFSIDENITHVGYRGTSNGRWIAKVVAEGGTEKVMSARKDVDKIMKSRLVINV